MSATKRKADAAPSGAAPPRHPTVVGVTEIAEDLGITATSINDRRTRGRFPAPDYRIGGRPAWESDTIAEWWADRATPPA